MAAAFVDLEMGSRRRISVNHDSLIGILGKRDTRWRVCRGLSSFVSEVYYLNDDQPVIQHHGLDAPRLAEAHRLLRSIQLISVIRSLGRY